MNEEHTIDVIHGSEFTNKYGYTEATLIKDNNYKDRYDYYVGPQCKDADKPDGKWTKCGWITEERFIELSEFFK